MKVRDVHADSLETSTALSGYYVKNFIAPLEVITVLNQNRLQFILLGTHALGGWIKKPRATPEVDVLLPARSHRRAAHSLLVAFPHLQASDDAAVTRLRDPATDKILIDVMRADVPLYRASLKHGHLVHTGGQYYKIPSLETAIAMKYAAMTSAHRPWADRFQDAHDFGWMIQSNSDIDPARLTEFGELIRPGGGQEIVEKVRQVRAGEKLNL